MRSSVYINEVTPEAVTLDFSASPAELASSGSCYGFAFNQTLLHLGLEAERADDPEMSAKLRVEGTMDQVRENIPQLRWQAGKIARETSMQQYGTSHDQQWLSRILGQLTGAGLPELSEDASLMRTMGLIVTPFADYVSKDGTVVYYGIHRHGEREDKIVKGEDGKLLDPFSVRDIGGLVIGWDGLPAHERMMINIKYPKADLNRLHSVAVAKDTRVGTELGQSLRHFLDAHDGSSIDPVSVEADQYTTGVSFPRTDLQEAYNLDLSPNANFGDVFRTALKAYLGECVADPELGEKVEAVKQRQHEIWEF